MKRAVLVALVAVLLTISGVASFYGYQVWVGQQNAAQALTYQNAILKDENRVLSGQVNSTGYHVGSGLAASAAFYIGTPDSKANSTLEREGFIPNCRLECPGITYYKDPTTVLTNEGLDYIQQMLTGVCSAGNCPYGGTSSAFWEGLSTSATGALVTDFYAGSSGPCSFSGGLIFNSAINTLSPLAGVVVGGTPVANVLTWTVTITWTYSTGLNTVNSGCLLSGTTTSVSNVALIAEISGVGPFTLSGGDTLKEVWSVTAT